MARKTIVKRAYKYWPRADRLDNAVDMLNESEGIFTEPTMPYTLKVKLSSRKKTLSKS
jgi:recombination protein RecT